MNRTISLRSGRRAVMFAASAFALASLTALPAPAADDVPDAKTLLAAVAKAAGEVPANYRETIVSEGPYVPTTTRTFHVGENVRVTTDRGPIHTEYGRAGGERWHQNENGLTVIDEPDPGLARQEPMTETVTRIERPVDGYLLARLTRGGLGSREYIDGQTFRVLRAETVTPIGTVTTTYEGYAYFGPRSLATRWIVDDGRFHTKTTFTRTAYDAGAATTADVGEPPIRRTLVEFPDGVARADLPVRFVNNRIYVRLEIAHRGLDFLLDTGASGISIDTDVARTLGLTLINRTDGANAGTTPIFSTIVPEIEIGTVRMHDIVLRTTPAPRVDEEGIRLVGLLGFDFLATLGVTIDYEHRRVTVEPAGSDPPSIAASATALPIRLVSQQPMITVRVDGSIAERMLIDTGADGSIVLFDYFARRYPEAVRDRVGVQRFTGVGGTVDANVVRLREIGIGGLRVTNVLGYRVVTPGSYPASQDGVIGTQILRLFTVELDYAHGHVYLTRNALPPA